MLKKREGRVITENSQKECFYFEKVDTRPTVENNANKTLLWDKGLKKYFSCQSIRAEPEHLD